MANSAQKAISTQKFIEILDIIDDIVVLSGGNAGLIIEVEASNFELLSPEEQDAKIFAYSSLLNSLPFSIQIVIRTKKIDISSYLKLLEDGRVQAKNEALSKQIELYKDFVSELVKVNSVLDKKFYIVLPYSSLEQGIKGAKDSLVENIGQSSFFIAAKTNLRLKAESVTTQLQRLNLKSQILTKEKSIKLFYDIFNDINITPGQESSPQVIDSKGGQV